MDAVKFIKEWKRMCDSVRCCEKCNIKEEKNILKFCGKTVKEDLEKAVAIVEQWSEEHPVKTRQSEFLKMFPNAQIGDREVVIICPRYVDASIPEGEICDSMTCSNCRKEYWLAEVE